MPGIKNNSALTIREIEYSVLIKGKDPSFSEIREILRIELTKFRENSENEQPVYDNPIQDFLKASIDRSIVIRDNTQVFFLNYTEKSGSFIIEFTLLIITPYTDFSIVRQALDYLIHDTVANYFEKLLERHVPVHITVQAHDKEIVTVLDNDLGAVESNKVPPRKDRLTRVFAISALVVSLCLAGFFTYKYFNNRWLSNNASLKEDYIDLMIEKKILEAVKDQKFNVNLYKIADTSGLSKHVTPASKGR